MSHPKTTAESKRLQQARKRKRELAIDAARRRAVLSLIDAQNAATDPDNKPGKDSPELTACFTALRTLLLTLSSPRQIRLLRNEFPQFARLDQLDLFTDLSV